MLDNHRGWKGDGPKAAQAVQFYNDFTALQTGRKPAPDTDTRTAIIADARRRYGASIQNDSRRSAELEQIISDQYAKLLRGLFTPVQAPPQ